MLFGARRPGCVILRGRESPYGTFGRLTMADFTCLTLELPDRDNRTNVSRIPAGRYVAKRVRTRRPFSGRPHSFWLHPVEGRTGILVHSGNFAGDVEYGLRTHSWGCILLGRGAAWINGQPGITQSRATVWAWMDRLAEETVIEVH